ncbi:MAG: RNA polymerase sigma factor [Planctomycetota bacterium]
MHAAIQSTEQRPALKARLVDLWERTGDPALQRLAEDRAPRDGVDFESAQERSDWLSTTLMEIYKNTGDAAVFALLFELNEAAFLMAIQGQLRRTSFHVDPADVLQEVFLNIYRYPHRFLSDRADAFRNWGHRIVRNTLLKFLRGAGRTARQHSLDEDMQCADQRARSPERAASDGEGAVLVNQAFILYLDLYLIHFERLSAKEQLALSMVEVEGRSYRDAAAVLDIRLENLKMVIFRGRRKIFRGMAQSLQQLDGLGSACRPVKAASSAMARRTRAILPEGRAMHPTRPDPTPESGNRCRSAG